MNVLRVHISRIFISDQETLIEKEEEDDDFVLIVLMQSLFIWLKFIEQTDSLPNLKMH